MKFLKFRDEENNWYLINFKHVERISMRTNNDYNSIVLETTTSRYYLKYTSKNERDEDFNAVEILINQDEHNIKMLKGIS